EMTSSEPCRRYGKALRRLGADDATCRFFDEHVTADALHEQLAAHDLCGGLAEAEPELADQIAFGAAACLYVDGRFAEHVFDSWDAGRSSLRTPSTQLQPPVAV
ncbi:iron-containing redox enzyme family protein, partial [uncultured Jatrophihabitans sp.]|uniref:iron-containing redox enzyme family protein n=1 Tax=uncultured Jatrophihabitans sp. TaxID=1610747 RepID=UPI0035CB1EE4